MLTRGCIAWALQWASCNKKGVFLYSACIQSVGPLKTCALYFTAWQTCSFRHQLGFSGRHSSQAAIMREDFSLTFPMLSYIASYSFIQLSELGENENTQPLKRYQRGFEPGFSPLRVRYSAQTRQLTPLSLLYTGNAIIVNVNSRIKYWAHTAVSPRSCMLWVRTRMHAALDLYFRFMSIIFQKPRR